VRVGQPRVDERGETGRLEVALRFGVPLLVDVDRSQAPCPIDDACLRAFTVDQVFWAPDETLAIA